MEPNEKEKPTDWKEIKLYTKLELTFVVIVMAPLLVFNYSRSTNKPIKILIAIAGAMIIVFSIILVLTILDINKLENETNETESSKTENSETKIQDFAKEKDESTKKATIFWFPQKRKGTIRVIPYYDHLIRDKGNTTSRTTPFPTKQTKIKRIIKDPIQQSFERDEKHLTKILAKNQNNTNSITSDLTTGLLKAETASTNEFENYICNNPPEGLTVETFDLTKDLNPPSVAPGVNPILSDLINQIQTHGDNIVIKQQGQQLTIKATLNQEKKTQENQWGEF